LILFSGDWNQKPQETTKSYHIAPREGHLECKKHPDGAIWIHTNIPDHESYHIPKKFDWSSSVYGNFQEDVRHDMPVPKGRVVCTTTYQDANLFHDLVTGHSMTGILHMLHQTPIHWFSNTKVMSNLAARTATEQIIDLHYTHCMMGVSIEGPSWMFGDNLSVITSSTIPESSLNKWHNALSYHLV
jgi:hypothetical protein